MCILNVFLLIIFSISLCENVYAVKVIKWPAYEDLPESQTTQDDVVNKQTSSSDSENFITPEEAEDPMNTEGPLADTEDINTNSKSGVDEKNTISEDVQNRETDIFFEANTNLDETTANEENAQNTENTPEIVTTETTTKTFQIKSSDFYGTLFYDLMENENGRVLVSAFLNAFSETVANKISSDLYLHISRHIKNLLKDSKTSKSISIISSSFTKGLTDEGTSEKFDIMMSNFKSVSLQPETKTLVQSLNKLATSLVNQIKSRRVIRTLGAEIQSILEIPDLKNAIVRAFQNLRSFTWPDSDGD